VRGYFGVRGSRSVLGLWKDTDVRVLRLMVEDAPLRAAFLAFLALESADFAAFFSSFAVVLLGGMVNVSDGMGQYIFP